MKLRLHHVQQRAADIQKAYHEHFHLTSRLFAYRSFFVIQGGVEKQLYYYLNRLLMDQYIIM